MAQPEIRPATAQLRRLTWRCFIRWATKQVIPRGAAVFLLCPMGLRVNLLE